MKNTSTGSVAKDPERVINVEGPVKGDRSEPGILEWSRVTAQFLCNPGPLDLGAPVPPAGTPLDDCSANTYFRIRHGLSRAPQLVNPQENSHPKGYGAEIIRLQGNTMERGAVILKTAWPVSDDQYCYFTVQLANPMYHEYNVLLINSTPQLQRLFRKSKWGIIKGATVNYRLAAFGPPLPTLTWARDYNTTPPSSDVTDFSIWSYATPPPAVEVHFSVFFGLPHNTLITVSMFSALLCNPSLPEDTFYQFESANASAIRDNFPLS